MFKGKPDVKYIGGIHGNEPVGKELLLHLIEVRLQLLSFKRCIINTFIYLN